MYTLPGYNGYNDRLSLDYDDHVTSNSQHQPAEMVQNGDLYTRYDQSTVASYNNEIVNPLTEEDLAPDLYEKSSRKTVGWDEDNLIQEETYHQEPYLEQQHLLQNGYCNPTSNGLDHTKESEYSNHFPTNDPFAQEYYQFSNNYGRFNRNYF